MPILKTWEGRTLPVTRRIDMNDETTNALADEYDDMMRAYRKQVERHEAQITIVIYSSHLDPDEGKATAIAEKYGELVLEQVERAYPEYEVSVNVLDGVTGAGSGVRVGLGLSAEEYEIAQEIACGIMWHSLREATEVS